MYQKISNQLSKLLSGNASKDEIHQINVWYDEFESEKDIYLNDFQNRTKTQIRNSLYSKIERELNRSDSKTIFLGFSKKIAGIAAIILIGILGLAQILIPNQQQPKVVLDQNTIFFSNEDGMIKKIHMPDGSSIFLHHYSQIEATRDFKSNRTVKLSGKAFFDVVPDPNSPFVIQTENLNTEVLGTSFSVSAYPGEQESVAVKSGKVNVSFAENEKILLEVNESARLENHGLTKSIIVELDMEFGWIDKTIVFQKTSMESMVMQLEHWYGVKITCNCNRYPSREISGVYKDMSLEELLTAIQFSIPLKFRIYEQKVIIEFKDCN